MNLKPLLISLTWLLLGMGCPRAHSQGSSPEDTTRIFPVTTPKAWATMRANVRTSTPLPYSTWLQARNPDALQALLADLRSQDAAVRKRGLSALIDCTRCDSLDVKPGLWDVALEIIEGQDRNALIAIEALPKIHRSRATTLLSKICHDPLADPAKRRWALDALGYCTPGDTVVETLLEELQWHFSSPDHVPAQDLPHIRLDDCLFLLGRNFPRLIPALQTRVLQAWQAIAAKHPDLYDDSRYFLERAAPFMGHDAFPVLDQGLRVYPDSEQLWLRWVALTGKPALKAIDALLTKPESGILGQVLLAFAFPGDPEAAIAHYKAIQPKCPDCNEVIFISAFAQAFGRQAVATHSDALLQLYLDRTPEAKKRFRSLQMPVPSDHPVVAIARKLVAIGALPSMPDTAQIESFRDTESLWPEFLPSTFYNKLPRFRPSNFGLFQDSTACVRHFHTEIFSVDPRLMRYRCHADSAFKRTPASKPVESVWFENGQDALQVLPGPYSRHVSQYDCITAINQLLERDGIPERFVPVPHTFFGGFYFATPADAAAVFEVLKPAADGK